MLAKGVIGEWPLEFFLDIANLLSKIFEVLMQPIEDRDETRRQSILGQYRGQAPYNGVADRKADSELKQESMHLVGRAYSIAN